MELGDTMITNCDKLHLITAAIRMITSSMITDWSQLKFGLKFVTTLMEILLYKFDANFVTNLMQILLQICCEFSYNYPKFD